MKMLVDFAALESVEAEERGESLQRLGFGEKDASVLAAQLLYFMALNGR